MNAVRERFEKYMRATGEENFERFDNGEYVQINVKLAFDWFRIGFESHHDAIKEKIFENPNEYIS